MFLDLRISPDKLLFFWPELEQKKNETDSHLTNQMDIGEGNKEKKDGDGNQRTKKVFADWVQPKKISAHLHQWLRQRDGSYWWWWCVHTCGPNQFLSKDPFRKLFDWITSLSRVYPHR